MIAPLAAKALRQAGDLAEHYDRLERPEAIRNLVEAIEAAQAAIPQIKDHVAAPRPYPGVARSGTGWIKIGRYWFAYGTRQPRMIRGIYHDTADIPRRIG